jgi:F0F1-type ATP synthase membrane subunit b/b'
MEDFGGWVAKGGLGALLLAAGHYIRPVLEWMKGQRAEKREAATSVVEGAGAAVDVMKSVMEAVNARLKESEAECERRVEAAIQTIRAEWENERKGLRAAIAALSALLPPDARKRLDERLRAIVDEIAPEAVA